MMVNAYVSYKTFCELRGLKPISHYDFQKNIALAWIDKDVYANQKTKSYITPHSSDCGTGDDTSTLTSNSTGRSQKKETITNFTLHPYTGSLKRRLNHSFGHWPTRGDRNMS